MALLTYRNNKVSGSLGKLTRVTDKKNRKTQNFPAKKWKSGLFSTTRKRLVGWRSGFLYIISQNEQRIHLNDTTHVAITGSELSDFSVGHLGYFEVPFSLNFFILFFTHSIRKHIKFLTINKITDLFVRNHEFITLNFKAFLKVYPDK